MEDSIVREHVIKLLGEGHAHLTAAQALRGVPFELWGRKPDGVPHTLWQLLEHLRITQWDILEFTGNASHQSPTWPDNYWPPDEAPPNEAAVKKSLDAFHAGLKAMQALVRDEATDLSATVLWGDGQTILREALLLADHNAYHVGQFIFLRRLLGSPPA